MTKGLEKVAFMQRDQTQFEEYGITTTFVNDLKTLIGAFSGRLTDEEALGDQMNSTALKNDKAEELREAIRVVMARVVLTYNLNSGTYHKFGTNTLSRQTDGDLGQTAKRVVRVGTDLMASLAFNGLTSGELDTITTLDTEFSRLITEQQLEIADRDIEQEDRVEAGNAIYTTLVKYTNTGQSIWESSDVAKFNDYVLYNTHSGEPEEETPAPSAA
ncbi:hypothetical protein [Flavobacterium sp.]|uniref:hypothetical protein n=1 Tax=Flavobacterium sp. TaxID=239 RepID=UPI0025E17ECB|nr:hypothetical protein [Flavobacterium sp.]